MATNMYPLPYPYAGMPYQQQPNRGNVCRTILCTLLSLVVLSAVGGLVWWFTVKKETVFSAVPVRGFTVTNDALKNVSAVSSDIPANCSGGGCNVSIVTPVDTNKTVTGASATIHTDTAQERCTQRKGYRIPGAGYKAGYETEQISPGYGTVVDGLDVCHSACEKDEECLQYTFDIANKKCYKMNKKYPYTAADLDSKWDSGEC